MSGFGLCEVVSDAWLESSCDDASWVDASWAVVVPG